MKKIAMLPTLLTLGNVVCGFVSITFASKILVAQEAPNHCRRRGRRAESEQAFADGRAAAERALRHPRGTCSEAVHVAASRLDDQGNVEEVRDDADLELRVAGVRHALDPGERAGLGPLLAVYPDVLGTAAVDSDGTLRLLFASGSSLVVPPDDHYEAWQIEGPGTRLVVCTPGGTELAVWT